MLAIESTDLTKIYSDGVPALVDFNISINRGELFTLLGPNGAGKTTFLRIVATQLLPTSGNALVMGCDVVNDPLGVRKHIAVVPQDVIAYGMYTPWEYAYFFARFRGLPRQEALEIAQKALRAVGLWELRNRICAKLSGGEKRRAIIASALSSKGDVLMLDEPTSGLDAIARRNVWTTLREIVKDEKTILLTTHNMEEAELISDRLAIIHKGKVIAEGKPQAIRGLVSQKYRVVVEGDITCFPEMDSTDHVIFGDKCIFYVKDETEAANLMKEALRIGLYAHVSQVTLEDVFVKLAGSFENESN